MSLLVQHDVFASRLQALEAWLWSDGAAALRLGRQPDVSELAQRVEALSDVYTVDRDAALSDAAGRAHLRAKVFYFLSSDAPKASLVLREVEQARVPIGRGSSEKLRVLDLGAGVGATAVGVLLSLDAASCPAVELAMIDADPAALSVAAAVVAKAANLAGLSLRTNTAVRDLTKLSDSATANDAALAGPWDLVIAQAVLNELPLGDDADAARSAWISRWARQGLTAIIEPALRATTQPLQRARDHLLASADSIHVIAPCPHQSRCPMLAESDRDWCHEVRTIDPTPRVMQVQSITRRRDDRTKFSFMVFAPMHVLSTRLQSDESLPDGATSLSSLQGRLVSDALNSKGKCERVVCASNGQLLKLRLLDRERTDDNAALADEPRGTVVSLRNITGPRVGRDASVIVQR